MEPSITHDLIGLHPNVESAMYHASPGLSFTGFKHFMRSPRHYQTFLKTKKEQTAAQKLGTLVHMATLEPDLFEKATKKMEGPLNTNPWKKEADECKAKGIIPIGSQMWEDVMGMRDSMIQHPEFGYYLSSGSKEVSAFWHDPETGVLLRCRPDIWHEESLTVVDLKTCGDASEQGFPRIEMLRNQYHIQSAWYLMGLSVLTDRRVTRHVHACVETDPPYASQLHALNDASIERAMMDIRHHLVRYRHCLETNEWPGLPTGINQTALPAYAWAEDYVNE